MHQSEQLPFFVYGTLLPDQPNFYLWDDSIIEMQPAKFWGGQLYDMGFYPMLVVEEAETAVHGQLITVRAEAYEAVLQRLDVLEGYDPAQPDSSEYIRQQVSVTLADGRSADAWLYLGQPELVADKPEIPGGNWAVYAAENQQTLQEWWEAIQTVAGLHNPTTSNPQQK